MYRYRNKLLFYGATVVAGAACLGLYRYMMDHCMDDKGLLIAGNLPGILQMLVGVAFAFFVGLLARTLGGDGTYEDNFPREIFSGVLLLAAGVVMILAIRDLGTKLRIRDQVTVAGVLLGWGSRILPWLAAGSMAVLGVYRMRGMKPLPIFSGVICLHYMVMLVDNYRLWSADPQIHDYAYQLLAGVLLMLCAFHRTCCDAEIIQRKKLILTGLGAAVCCVAAASMSFQRHFYVASALWAVGCICDLAVLPPDPEETEEAPVQNEE